MIDVQSPGSPGWWLDRLYRKLSENRARYDMLDAYYKGEAGIPVLASKAARESYQRLMQMARMNFAELVVEAVRERMVPISFRTGAAGDDLGDQVAWDLWQANSLDADSALVHRTALSLGDAYVIVGGVDPEIGAPLITPEDPRQVVTESDPRRRRKTVAGLKVFRDDVQGADMAYLYLPGEVYRAGTRGQPADTPFNAQAWSWLSDEPDRLPAPVVPVVRFPNRADLYGRGYGEFETHVGLLNRINYTILNRLEIATLQAFRQRAAKNLPNVDENGNQIDYSDVFNMDPGAFWLLPEGAELWESGQVDLSGVRAAIRDDVQDLAAVTRTPLFYLTPEANNGSAEGASLAREGLVFKTGDRIVQTAESWEQVMSLAFTFAGDAERASRRDMQCLFASPERFSLAERFDAATKAQAAGVPWRQVMSDVLQYSPQDIARMEAERASDALLAASLLPTTAPAAPAA